MQRITTAEMVALADRLIGRGNSVVLRDMPELQKDLVLAGRIISSLILTGIVNQAIELT
jgi:hypothetical protein